MKNEDVIAKAKAIWSALDANGKTIIRFGMFPNDEMQKAIKEGFDQHALCIALMDCATADGGMRS